MEIRGNRFVDDEGRRLILRGVNLGGSTKVPVNPDGRTHLKEGFYDGGAVSFVGRPFPLSDADAHFERLARWGQGFIRFLVTWEAVEHEGPGIYDEAYLAYLEAIAEKAASRNISLFIDPHQDVWSRWSGGDGAPLWTLEALGFEARNFQASGAAMLHEEMGDEYPRMQWFSNYQRLAAATMFTLFFGGDDFAPGLQVSGEPVQDFLQGRYIAAMRELARRLSPFPNVVGFDSLNEPGAGYIGLPDLRRRREGFTALGPAPTPWEALLAGEGLPVDAETLGVRGLGISSLGRKPFGTPGVRAWKAGETCIWRRLGLWDLVGEEPRLLKPGWFAERLGAGAASLAGSGDRPYATFNELYLKPFVARFAREIRRAAPSSGDGWGSERFAIFVEGVPEGGRPAWGPNDTPRVVNGTHWYDSFTLTLKRWTGFLAFDPETERPIIGPRAVRRFFSAALARILAHSRVAMGGVPTLLGEYGLPFDLNGRRAFRTGNYRLHERALAAYYDAIDANLLDATIWNYTADNSHARGDGWNGEDLSVFCADEAAEGRTETGDPRDAGGRALRGFVRPYAVAVAGDIVSMSFSLSAGEFRLRFRPDPTVSAPTEIFVPRLQYPRGFSVESAGLVVARREATQTRAEALENSTEDELPPLSEPIMLELRPDRMAEECLLVLRRL